VNRRWPPSRPAAPRPRARLEPQPRARLASQRRIGSFWLLGILVLACTPEAVEPARAAEGPTGSTEAAVPAAGSRDDANLAGVSETSPPATPGGLWIDPQRLATRPTEGPAWEALRRTARGATGRPDLSDQDDPTNVRVLAKALIAARTGDAEAREDVVRALRRVRGTEQGARALAVARELMAYVLAADLIGLEGEDRAAFVDWLEVVRRTSFRGRTLRSTHEDRPNNWGTHAGASRIAVARYLGDEAELERAAFVFRGWLGQAEGWRGFEFGDAAWQPPFSWRRYAVNPVGATRKGHSIDGVLPDDQRRGGAFRWPPPKENYVWEALQGAVAQAVLLDRAGYDAWSWGDRALLRALRWLHEEADYPAEGDDTWIPHLVNDAYGSDFPAPVPSQPGKGMGFSDWTHGPSEEDVPGSGSP
jgi:hypothetical protein